MDRSYKILCVTNNYTPYSGGVVSAINALYQGLEERNHHMLIVTLDFQKNHPAFEKNVYRLYCPLRFRYYTNYMAIPWRPYTQLAHVVREFKPDIIHAHHPFLLGPLAAKIARKLKIPLLFTYHTQYEQYAHYLTCPTIVSKPIIKSLVKKFCNSASAIIAPSQSIKEMLQQEHIKTPIHVIPSPIDELFLRSCNIKPSVLHKINLITVSRFVPEKNIPFLLDVFSQLDQTLFSFTLIGYGPEKEFLINYAYNTLKLDQKNIRFIEKPPKNVIKMAYEEADIFIFASLTETQGLVLAEAMACGTPVIALNGPGSKDIIISEYNGFIVQTAQEMIMAINTIACNPSLLKTLQQNAFQTAQQFKSSAISAHIEHVIAQYVNKRA